MNAGAPAIQLALQLCRGFTLHVAISPNPEYERVTPEPTFGKMLMMYAFENEHHNTSESPRLVMIPSNVHSCYMKYTDTFAAAKIIKDTSLTLKRVFMGLD